MFVFSHFGKPTAPEMCDLIDKAAAKHIFASAKLEGASSKYLATEGKAIANFIKDSAYLENRGFALA